MISNPRFRIVRTSLYGAPGSGYKARDQSNPESRDQKILEHKMRVFGTVS